METGNGAHMDDALAFVPSGANLLEAVRGERNGEGVEYQLLVIDQSSPEGLSPSQHGPNRVLLLLRGNGDGRWQLAARNDTLVPCSTHGGLAGDPFAYAMVEEDTFSVITNGGSRQRWSSTYTLSLFYEVALALFIGLGPLFILCLLFEQTKTLFQKWLFYGIGTGDDLDRAGHGDPRVGIVLGQCADREVPAGSGRRREHDQPSAAAGRHGPHPHYAYPDRAPNGCDVLPGNHG